MSLERLDDFFGSDKSKQTLIRTEQAFRMANLIEKETTVPVRVVIRDLAVVVEAQNSAAATKLSLHREGIDQIAAAVIGSARAVRIKVKRTGRLD